MRFNKEQLAKNERVKVAFLWTFFWGLLAHGFAFANLNLSHDSLNEYYISNTVKMKLSLGRFSQPILRVAMGEFVTLPWLSGMVSLLLLFGVVFLTVEIFELRRTGEIALLSGVFTANLSVTALIATYIHDLAGDMMALFLSVFVVYLWNQTRSKFRASLFCLAALSVATFLGFYQAFLSVTVVMIMLYSIMELLKGEKALRVFREGLYGIGILVVGIALYAGLVVLSCKITGIPLSSGEYNDLSNLSSINQSLHTKLLDSYIHVLWAYLGLSFGDFSLPVLMYNLYVPSLFNLWLYLRLIFNFIVFILTAALFLIGMVKRKRGTAETLLMLVLVITLPIAMDLSYIGSGSTHLLMQYSYWLLYLFLGLLLKWITEESLLPPAIERHTSLAAAGIILILLVHMVQISNTLYTKKELEGRATLSTMTRVLSRIEEYEDYIYDETPVALISYAGITAQTGLRGMGQIPTIVGAWYNSDVSSSEDYKQYFQNVLQYPINLCDNEVLRELMYRDEVIEMPLFPHRDCIKMIDGILVVKMGDF